MQCVGVKARFFSSKAIVSGKLPFPQCTCMARVTALGCVYMCPTDLLRGKQASVILTVWLHALPFNLLSACATPLLGWPCNPSLGNHCAARQTVYFTSAWTTTQGHPLGRGGDGPVIRAEAMRVPWLGASFAICFPQFPTSRASCSPWRRRCRASEERPTTDWWSAWSFSTLRSSPRRGTSASIVLTKTSRTSSRRRQSSTSLPRMWRKLRPCSRKVRT